MHLFSISTDTMHLIFRRRQWAVGSVSINVGDDAVLGKTYYKQLMCDDNPAYFSSFRQNYWVVMIGRRRQSCSSFSRQV